MCQQKEREYSHMQESLSYMFAPGINEIYLMSQQKEWIQQCGSTYVRTDDHAGFHARLIQSLQ